MTTEQLANVARGLQPIARKVNLESINVASALLEERLRSPRSFVTVIGETSTGKSTLINGLFNNDILPVSATPTTAAVTMVVCEDIADPTYVAVWRDGRSRALDREEFVRMATVVSKDLLRLEVHARPREVGHLGLVIVDTPGYNSVVAEHEEILRGFLPESDVIVFVVGYRTGVGQEDQELFSLVKDATRLVSDIPTLLVINRAPLVTRGDRRVQQIILNSSDCLGHEPDLVVVNTTGEPGVVTRPNRPDAGPVWTRVQNVISAPSHQSDVVQKLRNALAVLLRELSSDLERKHLMLSATDEDIKDMKGDLEILRDARNRSIVAVDRAFSRLGTTLPMAIETLAKAMSDKACEEVSRSDKWLGQQECNAWVSTHVLPFEAREAGCALERDIAVELERLDRELEDIANTAIKQIEHQAHVRSDAARQLGVNLVMKFGRQAGGELVFALLGGIGGVGGAAAGAGNLVKMLLSRVGGLFGKTFSREVYNQIGRFFTKRMLARLNVVVAVLIDVGLFVHEANTWRGELQEKIRGATEEWKRAVTTDLLEESLPTLKKANVATVCSLYDDAIQDAASIWSDGEANRREQADVVGRLVGEVHELQAAFNAEGGQQ